MKHVALAIAALVLMLAGALTLTKDAPEATFCDAAGFITESGETIGKDPEQGCQWVDDEGNVLPHQERYGEA